MIGSTVLSILGSLLMLASLVCLGAAMLSITRAWRHGLPWWSGMVWFTPTAQPPAARPHMRSAVRRFGCFMVLNLLAMAMLIMAGG